MPNFDQMKYLIYRLLDWSTWGSSSHPGVVYLQSKDRINLNKYDWWIHFGIWLAYDNTFSQGLPLRFVLRFVCRAILLTLIITLSNSKFAPYTHSLKWLATVMLVTINRHQHRLSRKNFTRITRQLDKMIKNKVQIVTVHLSKQWIFIKSYICWHFLILIIVNF